MADVTGAQGTLNISQTIRKTDMAPEILLLEPNSAPLTVLTNRLSSRPTGNPEFSWQEDDAEPRFDAVNGTTGTGTAVIVDNHAYFAEHDLVKVTRTGEVMRVTAVTSGTSTLTVVRGVGGSAIALADNDELLIIGSAQPEGDTSKPARSENPTKVTNYTQIIRTPWHSTRTLRQSQTFTNPTQWKHTAAKKSIEHAKDWEYTYFHGKPSENTSGSQPRRTTGGVFHFVTTNVTAAGGTLTEAEFFGGFSGAFRYGSGTKVAFASRLAVDVVNGFPRGKLESIQADNDATYGINVQKFVSPHGTLNFVTHNLLEGSVYGGYIVVLDMQFIKERYLSNEEGSSQTQVRQNIQANDEDGRKDEILSEKGLEFGQEEAHALFTGIAG